MIAPNCTCSWGDHAPSEPPYAVHHPEPDCELVRYVDSRQAEGWKVRDEIPLGDYIEVMAWARSEYRYGPLSRPADLSDDQIRTLWRMTGHTEKDRITTPLKIVMPFGDLVVHRADGPDGALPDA